jgi:hypothetical protein
MLLLLLVQAPGQRISQARDIAVIPGADGDIGDEDNEDLTALTDSALKKRIRALEKLGGKRLRLKGLDDDLGRLKDESDRRKLERQAEADERRAAGEQAMAKARADTQRRAAIQEETRAAQQEMEAKLAALRSEAEAREAAHSRTEASRRQLWRWIGGGLAMAVAGLIGGAFYWSGRK